jgi:MFS family permease
VPPLLRRPPFRNFWLGQTISVVGDQVTLLAIPIIAALVLNASPADMGLLTAVGLLPHLLFSLPAGVVLDRVERRRRLMIVVDISRAAFIATIPIAFVLNVLSLEQLYVITFAVGTLAVLFDISWNTLFVAVTPRQDFVAAQSLLNGSRSLANILGPSLGGILIQFLGAATAMLTDALSYIASALFLGRVKATEPPIEPAGASIRTQLATGLRFILRDPIMRPALLAVATVNLFNFAFHALFILYVTTFLGVSPGALGLALGIGALGGLLGAVVAGRIGRRIGLGPAYALGLVLFPVSLVAIPLVTGSPEIVLAMLAITEFGAGFGVMILDINGGTILQARTPDVIRGRSMGAFRFINFGVRPVGALIGGALGTAIGVRETLIVSTLLSLAGVLWLIGAPVLRLRDVPAPAEGYGQSTDDAVTAEV